MHLEVLNNDQKELFPLLKAFRRSFYLVGGTAIALHIGHRQSIDFDLFRFSKLNKPDIRKKLDRISFKKTIIHEDTDQMHYVVNNVKLTFFNYPYNIQHDININEILKMPDLLSLAAMKAFALGRRAKWKDYVDMYFMINKFYSIEQISEKAKELFDDQFSEKLFRQQLAFHSDIDYSETVEFLVDAPSDTEIKEFLIEKAIDIF